jgi:hypothetical protein
MRRMLLAGAVCLLSAGCAEETAPEVPKVGPGSVVGPATPPVVTPKVEIKAPTSTGKTEPVYTKNEHGDLVGPSGTPKEVKGFEEGEKGTVNELDPPKTDTPKAVAPKP